MAASWNQGSSIVEPYQPPEWASNLPLIPKYRLKLARLPTPIERWNITGIPEGVQLHIKRDDLTGCTLSGNKARKLEFIMGEAAAKGYRHVITAGPITSNHCRTTAVAAAQAGLKCHLFLKTDDKVEDIGCEGNMFFNRLCGAEMYFTPAHYHTFYDLWPRQKQLAEKIEKETGEKCYILPVGGSDSVGLFGYLEAFQEMLEQGLLDHVTDIAFPAGSGGTATGLAVANYLTNSRVRLHAFVVAFTAEYFHTHCNAEFEKLGLPIRSEDVFDCIDEYMGPGYRKAQDADLEFITRVAADTGIILDPTYTGKAARGLCEELKKNSQRFQGSKILFLYTGGLFGAMDHEQLIEKIKEQSGHNLQVWRD